MQATVVLFRAGSSFRAKLSTKTQKKWTVEYVLRRVIVTVYKKNGPNQNMNAPPRFLLQTKPVLGKAQQG